MTIGNRRKEWYKGLCETYSELSDKESKRKLKLVIEGYKQHRYVIDQKIWFKEFSVNNILPVCEKCDLFMYPEFSSQGELYGVFYCLYCGREVRLVTNSKESKQ